MSDLPMTVEVVDPKNPPPKTQPEDFQKDYENQPRCQLWRPLFFGEIDWEYLDPWARGDETYSSYECWDNYGLLLEDRWHHSQWTFGGGYRGNGHDPLKAGVASVLRDTVSSFDEWEKAMYKKMGDTGYRDNIFCRPKQERTDIVERKNAEICLIAQQILASS